MRSFHLIFKSTIYKIFVLLIPLCLFPANNKCQSFTSDYSVNNIVKCKNDSSTGDSINNSYISYKLANIYLGYNSVDYKEDLFIQSDFFFNISYRFSDFYYTVEEQSVQVGLYNEFGFNNLSIYYDVGPEIRILYDFYIIPNGGISFAITNHGLGFLAYLGAKLGFIKKITENMYVVFEAGTHFLLTKENSQNKFIKGGLGFSFF